MKNYIYISLVLVFLASCKKQESIVEVPTTSSVSGLYSDAKVENGYLVFKNYESFLSSLTKMYNVNDRQRIAEEKALSFVSLKSIYGTFNAEMDQLEKGSAKDYKINLATLYKKYRGQINYTDSSYSLNCSGLAESCLANAEGIVKVGNDFLHFNKTSIATYRNSRYADVLSKIKNGDNGFEDNQLNNEMASASMKDKTSYLVALNPSGLNSFSVVSTPFAITMGNSDRARFIVRAKLYNIHNNTIGRRGYATYECNAEHKNIFGTWRDVKYIVGTGGQIDVMLLQNEAGYPFGKSTDFRVNISASPNSIDEGIKEFVIIASNSLIANPSMAVPQNGYIQFNPNVASVNDDFAQSNGYWRSIASGGFLQAQADMSAMIIGDAIFSYPSVDFGTFNVSF